MKHQIRWLTGFDWIVVALLMIFSIPALAECGRTVTTKTQTEVFDRPPSFSTGSGWKIGNRIDTITAGSQVKLCESVDVGLFGDKRTWYLIAWDKNIKLLLDELSSDEDAPFITGLTVRKFI